MISLLYHFRNKTLSLIMRPNPSPLSRPFSSHSMLGQLSWWHLTMDTPMLWRSYWQQGLIPTIKIKYVTNLVTRVMLIHVPNTFVPNKVLYSYANSAKWRKPSDSYTRQVREPNTSEFNCGFFVYVYTYHTWFHI